MDLDFGRDAPMKLLSEYDQSAVNLAHNANRRILGLNRRIAFGPKQIPPNCILYHYTTAEGLKGIIENNELWATSAYFLNDSAEITYGYGVLKEVLDGWIVKNPRSEQSLSLGLARALRQSFGDDLLNRNIIHPIYLACFCEEDNLLSQWRAYGKSGGYSLGFKVPADYQFTGQGFKAEPTVYTSPWVKVEYDRREQVKKCGEILDPAFVILDDSDTARAIATIGEHPLFGYAEILRVLTDLLLDEIVGFKDEAFKLEKEWRLVVRRRELLKQGTDDGGKAPVPLNFRTSNGMLIPYVKIIPTDPAKKLPIACIRSGPMLEKTTTAMSVRMLLDKNGFPNTRVRVSEITDKCQFK
jgi:hypothetical protein